LAVSMIGMRITSPAMNLLRRVTPKVRRVVMAAIVSPHRTCSDVTRLAIARSIRDRTSSTCAASR
jgi:hypothetical protein